MFCDNEHINRGIGMLASTCLTLTALVPSPVDVVSCLPHWATYVREWSLLIGAPIGVLGMLFYASSMALDSRRKWREYRESQKR